MQDQFDNPLDKPPPKTLAQFRRENKQSGIGGAILLGTGLLAGIAAAGVLLTMGVGLGLAAALAGGLTILGSAGYLQQQRKKTLNQYHAYRAYPQLEGYHREPEYRKDTSLMHRIQGPSDLKERVKYLENHYDIKVKTREQYGAKYGIPGTAASVLAGIGTALAISAICMSVFAAPVVLASIGFGILAGGTAQAISSAHVTHKYDQYIDRLAGQLRAKEMQKKPAADPMERPPSPPAVQKLAAPAEQHVFVQPPRELHLHQSPLVVQVRQDPSASHIARLGARRGDISWEEIAQQFSAPTPGR